MYREGNKNVTKVFSGTLLSCPFLIFDLSALTCILKYINILTYGQSFKDTILKKNKDDNIHESEALKSEAWTNEK